MRSIGEHTKALLANPHSYRAGREPTVRERLIDDRPKIAKMIKQGCTTKDVSKHYGINLVTVQCYIREAIGDTLMEQLKDNTKKLRSKK